MYFFLNEDLALEIEDSTFELSEEDLSFGVDFGVIVERDINHELLESGTQYLIKDFNVIEADLPE